MVVVSLVHINIRQILDQQDIFFKLLKVRLELSFANPFRNGIGQYGQALVNLL